NVEVLGEVRLLTSLIGRFEALGKWWFRVCPLHPQAGKVGVLCLPQPPPSMPSRERLARILLGLWLIGWGVVLVYRLLTGEMPIPGVRLGLVMWFLALVSVPTMLSISTSASFLSDLESNLHHQKRQEMMQTFREVEAGSTSLGERYSVQLRRLTQNRQLCQQLLDAQHGKGNVEQVMQTLWQETEKQEIELMAVLVFGHGGFTQNVFHKTVTPEVQRAFQQFVGEFGDTTLRQADPELYEKEKARMLASGQSRPKRGQFEGLASSSFLLTQMDSSADFRMGRRHLMKYHNSLGFDGHTYFSIFFIWDQDPLYRRYLETAIPEANRRYDWLSLGAFRDQGDQLETIWKPRLGEDLTTWAEQAREQVIWDRGRDRLLYAYPSKRMPGYVLAATGSLHAVQDAIRQEVQRIVFTLIFLVLLVGLSSAGLSHWLASPILRMTEGLRQVAHGNLQIQVAENRDDELGEAGTTLDTMTGWLRERRLMTRFVAPQVLELIQSGTMDQNCSATTQEAVALVSDIRNFTTLSETHPPAEVFAALNYHLQVMTRVIREQNGYIDRFIGDAIQAVFYPGDVPAAVRAVRAAAGMRRGHHLIQVHRERQKKFVYEIGIGIDCGVLVTGVLGDPELRQEYSVLGEPMKHAAELEALSKLGTATRIICSTPVVHDCGLQDHFRHLEGHENCWELVKLPEARS
ncbi:MAG TPA: adenylate/guanylate cyclase domain-containing protein, partial [Candidatus Ozemobacteraceae bacterium]|nr:adenylate/guanylate cyclase domain-containing protein [Candidatus Ozemobacteraceae bacterium]